MPVVDAEDCTSAAAQSSSAPKHSNTNNNTKKHHSFTSFIMANKSSHAFMHPRTVNPWRSALLSSSAPATFSCHKDQRTVCAFLQCPFSDSCAHGTMNPPFPAPPLLAATVLTSILPGAMLLLLEWDPVSWQNPLLTAVSSLGTKAGWNFRGIQAELLRNSCRTPAELWRNSEELLHSNLHGLGSFSSSD
ncbi:E3 ubiquitin-protein ligase SH3RF1-like [Marmota monax]|uniref:E3 ubiquitin-protein ligase SH3RF1-like n=1 Tax=Marmota monax TaxID=9995 RepID=UPI0026F0E346|nr:E3 ubiquitin-protein ligase SH3RF1-like [Marmota monax]